MMVRRNSISTQTSLDSNPLLRGYAPIIAISGSDIIYDIRKKINLSILAYPMVQFFVSINIK